MATAKRSKHGILIAAFVAMLATFAAVAAEGDMKTVKGLITAVNGNTLTVRDENNVDHMIVTTGKTEYKKRVGMTGVARTKVEEGAMMPGLPITADLVERSGQMEALAISFKSEDFRTAQQVQAGVAPTSAKVDAMGQRMDDFGKIEALATTEVLFASGSTALNEKSKSDLQAIAQKAKDIQNYMIVMQGYTDSTGNAAANQRLSQARATAVANYLQTTGGLMPGRVTAGDGMGIAPDAGSGSNAGARKVVVKLVASKGVVGK